MWAYVDESGCLGMKLGSGSSLFFCVGVIVFSDKETTTACYNRIEQLRTELRVRHEFKFSRTSDEQRVRFLAEMMKFDFNYFGIVIDKAQIGGFQRPFLDIAVRAAFANHASRLKDVRVTIDKTGSSDFRKGMHRDLKSSLNSLFEYNLIRSVKSVESHKNNLLQLADMVCGAVARSYYPSKRKPKRFRQIIRSREWQLLEYP